MVLFLQPVEGVVSRLERGVLPVQVTAEEVCAIADQLLPYEVGRDVTPNLDPVPSPDPDSEESGGLIREESVMTSSASPQPHL